MGGWTREGVAWIRGLSFTAATVVGIPVLLLEHLRVVLAAGITLPPA